jgi:hypothetical protein
LEFAATADIGVRRDVISSVGVLMLAIGQPLSKSYWVKIHPTMPLGQNPVKSFIFSKINLDIAK